MASSVHNQIIQNSNLTAQNRANDTSAKESSSSINSKDFLFLLTQQLQYQDPMNPMDNSQMLAQEAQFATLEQMEALTSSFSQFSSMYQANSLLGQNVEVTVDGKNVSGKVDYVDYSDTSGASISVKGKMYPLSSVSKVYPEDMTSQESDTNFFKTAAASIANNVNSITNKIFGYEEEANPEKDSTITPEANSTIN